MVLALLGAMLWFASANGASEAVTKPVYPLPPDEVLEHQRTRDFAVIEQLNVAGSNLSKPHSLEHHFYCYQEDVPALIIEAGKQRGFRASEVIESEYEGTRYWYFDLIVEVVPSIENVTAATTLMHQLSIAFVSEYDGWGSFIVE